MREMIKRLGRAVDSVVCSWYFRCLQKMDLKLLVSLRAYRLSFTCSEDCVIYLRDRKALRS